mgnify:CR=1 FL=1
MEGYYGLTAVPRRERSGVILDLHPRSDYDGLDVLPGIAHSPLTGAEEQPVTLSDIEQNLTTDFNGFPAGEDIPRLTSAEDFSEIIYLSDYVTAEPVGIVETGISSLKPWEDQYYTQRVKGRATGRQIRQPEITSSGLDLLGSYQPYYLLELPDHTYIVAQIPPQTAKRVKASHFLSVRR